MNLLQAFEATRQRSVDICSPLQIEDHVPQPAEFVSPPKWHLAHSTWFFEQMILCKYLPGYQVFDHQFGFLFNSYYNHVGHRTARGHRGHMTRPTVAVVMQYRAHVDAAMCLLLTHPNSQTNPWNELVILGIQHEQQHQELLWTDLKYILGTQATYPSYGKSLVSDIAQAQNWVSVAEGIYEIGFQGEGFCFDNEQGRHTVYLQSFEIATELVTNEEYLAFIQDGGYQRFELWLDEGWAWVNAHEARHPLYWQNVDGEWLHYTLTGLQILAPKGILAHINYYEAQAFATWKGMRLPTEFEWEVAADQIQWGKRWEWTNSAYLPYPAFKIAEGAVGEYNGKFMINQMVLRGASVATSAGHSRKTYRNFFHPHLQWQFAGIRLVRSHG